MSDALHPVTARHRAVPRGGILALMAVRNEADRLPFLLDYHRRLGVDAFAIADNGSTDGTLDFLASQPDVLLYRTTQSFRAAGCGMDWINAMLARHGEQAWCLFIDADELFTFPHAETVGLKRFCAHLDAGGAEGVFAVMVDMYGEGPVAETDYRRGAPFFEACPLFDTDYRLRRKLSLPWSHRFLEVEAIGGPRLRIFYPGYRDRGPLAMTIARALRSLRLHPLGRALGLSRTDIGSLPPDITKIPLMKGGNGRRWATNHRTVPLALSPVTGALLHFKFFRSFHDKAQEEAARGEHWDSGVEYRRYVDHLARHPGRGLAGPGSARFRHSDDLLHCGILTSSRALDRLAADLATEDGPGLAVAS